MNFTTTTATCFLLCLSPVALYADRGSLMAEVALSKVVRERSDNRSMADIAVFKGRLFVSFLEKCADSDRSCIRVMTSEDGTSWKTAAQLEQKEVGRHLMRRREDRSRYFDHYCFPRLDVVAGKRLMIRVQDAGPKSFSLGVYRTVGWSSVDGTNWKYEGERKSDGNDSRMTWYGDEGFSFEFDRGIGDGAAEKLWIYRTTDGDTFKEHYTYELPKFAPRRGSLFFVRDQAYFLLPRNGYGRKSNAKPSVGYVPGALGTSAPPYRDWTWKDIDEVIYSPQVVHLPSKGVFVVTELRNPKRHTALCRLNTEDGSLTELLDFGDLRREQTGVDPRKQNLGGSHIPLGLAVHDGHIWMSYCSGRSVKVRKIAIQ